MLNRMALEYAAERLDQALARRSLEPLDGEQREALEDPWQCFAMMADYEARIGIDVQQARAAMAEYHAGRELSFGGWEKGDTGYTRGGRPYRVIRVEKDGYMVVEIEPYRIGDTDAIMGYEQRLATCNGAVSGGAHNDLMAPVSRLELGKH